MTQLELLLIGTGIALVCSTVSAMITSVLSHRLSNSQKTEESRRIFRRLIGRTQVIISGLPEDIDTIHNYKQVFIDLKQMMNDQDPYNLEEAIGAIEEFLFQTVSARTGPTQTNGSESGKNL